MKDNIWDKIAKSFNIVSSRSVCHNEKYNIISNIIIKKNIKNLLDLGCGGGLLEKRLNQIGYKGEVTAIDGSSNMIEIAKSHKLNPKKNNFINMFIDDSFKIKKNYDGVVIINLLYLIENKNLLIKKISNKMNKNSTLIIVDPKPEGDIIGMIRENFSGKGFLEIIIYIIKEIKTIYHAIKFLLIQKKLDNKNLYKEIDYLELKELKKIILKNSFIIEEAKEIQARQNWFIIARRV